MKTVELQKVTVVITTYQRPKSLDRLLLHLFDQDHTKRDDIEVLISNDGSHSDDYRDVISNWESSFGAFRYYDEPRGDGPQLYRLKNRMAEDAEHELLWFLDDDSYFDTSTLFILRTYMRFGLENLVLVPHYANAGEPHHYQAPFPMVIAEPWNYNPDTRLEHWVSFAGLCMKKKMFLDHGGIDDRFNGHMGFADMHLGIKLWKAGAVITQPDGITIFIDDVESDGSHRDRSLQEDEARGNAHRNGRLFIELLGLEQAALYNIIWDEGDQRKYGWVWDESARRFVKG